MKPARLAYDEWWSNIRAGAVFCVCFLAAFFFLDWLSRHAPAWVQGLQ